MRRFKYFNNFKEAESFSRWNNGKCSYIESEDLYLVVY